MRRRHCLTILLRDTILCTSARYFSLGIRSSRSLGMGQPQPSGSAAISSGSWMIPCTKLQLILNREDHYLVLKIHVRSKRKLPEVAVVEHLRENQDDHPGQRFVRLIRNSFEITGPHGTHTCLLYPPAGLDMSDCMQCFPGGTLTVPLLRAVVRNILLALDYLHQANIIHTGTFWKFCHSCYS